VTAVSLLDKSKNQFSNGRFYTAIRYLIHALTMAGHLMRDELSVGLHILTLLIIILNEVIFYKGWRNIGTLLFAHRCIIFLQSALLPFLYTDLYLAFSYNYDLVLFFHKAAWELRYFEMIFAYTAVIFAIWYAQQHKREISKKSIFMVLVHSFIIYFPLAFMVDISRETIIVYTCAALLCALIALISFISALNRAGNLMIHERLNLIMKVVRVYAAAILVFILADITQLYQSQGFDFVYATIVLALISIITMTDKAFADLHIKSVHRIVYFAFICLLMLIDQSSVFLVQIAILAAFVAFKHIEWRRFYGKVQH
jgi:hypothetical protein